MKTVSPACAELINSGQFCSWDLYTFSCAGGQVIRLTTADFNAIDASANLYFCGGGAYPKIDTARSRGRGHWKRGLDSDTWTVTIVPQTLDDFSGALTFPSVVGSTPWLAAVRAGFFDNADVVVARGFWPAPSGAPISPTCAGSVVIFRGLVDTVDCTQTESVFAVVDYKSLLTITLPRNLYQTSCRHLVFDAGCTLSAATYATGASALAGSTQSVVLAATPPAGGSGTYQLGRMQFTSGLNSGLQRTIAGWSAGVFTMQTPWPFAVAPGDTMTVWPGCDKQLSTCQAFGNQLNFGGEPFIPDPTITLG